MNGRSGDDEVAARVAGRAAEIYREVLSTGYRNVDQLLAALLGLEWAAALTLALVGSPRAWDGESWSVHSHVWAALILGGTTVGLPIAMTFLRPGRALTRQCVAVAQMLVGSLLIHLGGGRPETHFHVFGSLAFLALYRDRGVLLTATLVVASDHYLRGMFWPRSIYGTDTVSTWRWAEHAAWVVFEGVVLAIGISRALRTLREAALRQAEMEEARDRIERTVEDRTAEILRARSDLEARVRERTAELEQANAALLGEVAERRRAEEALGVSERRFRDLAEALPQLVWVTRADGQVEYYNRRWYDYTGQTPGEALGGGWTEAVHPDDLPAVLEVWDRSLRSGVLYEVEFRFRRGEDRAFRWHLNLALPIRDRAGAITRWFGTSTDIHDRKLAEQALRDSRSELEARVRERTAELEQANAALLAEVAERRRAEDESTRSREAAELATRAKSDFLANMSHEIRTPMNAIIGMTDLTLDLDLTAEQRENLEVVRSSADSLLGLIEDILDFSKIEAGKLELDPVRFRPRETLADAIRTVQLRASEKGLELSSEVAAEVPEGLVGDPLRLRQVLLNLLGNAIKFTARGRVHARVDVEQAGPDGCSLRFSIEDQGIGIPAGRLRAIFDPFSQADGSTTRRFGGTGLGLSISTRLIGLMGGQIWVESEVGRGSTFRFTARFEAETALGPEDRPEPEEAPGLACGRLRVLLVDDYHFNRRVGLLLLERMGHEVVLAGDGLESLERYRAEGPFDLVLMDIQMPGIDGFEATARLRAIQAERGHRVPIVALTAHAMKGDRERCLEAGMDDYLTKPIKRDDLARVIEAQACRPRPATDDIPVPDGPNPWALDPEVIRSRFPMEDAEMADVVRLFRRGWPGHLARMRRSIAEDDARALASEAHGLMGCLGIFASEATVGLALDLEAMGRAGRLAGADLMLARLEAAVEGLRPVLDRLETPLAPPARSPGDRANGRGRPWPPCVGATAVGGPIGLIAGARAGR